MATESSKSDDPLPWQPAACGHDDCPYNTAPGEPEQADWILGALIHEGQRLGLYDMEIVPCTCGRMPPCRHLDDPGHP